MDDYYVDYHKNSNIFKQWFNDTSIPNLLPGSVIVLDNASYHSRQFRKILNKTSTNTEIQEFLISIDLDFEKNYKKSSCYNLFSFFFCTSGFRYFGSYGIHLFLGMPTLLPEHV